MSKVKVAINGFGRIGRAFYKQAIKDDDIEIVAINDLADQETLQYLLKYDSVYGVFDEADDLQNIKVYHEKDPKLLPWEDLGIDVVVESTGLFRTKDLAHQHIEAGAKRVVISAPSPDAETVLIGVNTDNLSSCSISSNASCTTNAINPVVAVLNEAIGVEKAILNTVHSYTSSQRTVDLANKKDLRRGRAAAINIIPTSTGAAQATAKAHTFLKGKFDGISLRVPTPAGSIIDLTFISSRDTTVEEVNTALKNASEGFWTGVLATTTDPLVLTDIQGRTEASIADLSMTRVVDGNLVKVLSWYDNEMGYAHTLLRHVKEASLSN